MFYSEKFAGQTAVAAVQCIAFSSKHRCAVCLYRIIAPIDLVVSTSVLLVSVLMHYQQLNASSVRPLQAAVHTCKTFHTSCLIRMTNDARVMTLLLLFVCAHAGVAVMHIHQVRNVYISQQQYNIYIMV
jgi:hypothetical protein